MGRRADLLLATTAALLLAAGGCAGGASPSASSASAERDAAIQDAIEEGLRRDPGVERIPVRVRVDDGRVVLYGSVETPAESDRVEQIARSTSGVRGVENNLHVAAGTDAMDRQIPIDAVHGPAAR